MRRAAKVDSNHRVVVEAFRGLGCTVQSLAAVGAGVPDLLVGCGGRNYLVEVKDGAKAKSSRKLTDAQVTWQRMWRGDVALVESVEDAARCVQDWRRQTPVPSDVEVDPSDYERPRRELRVTPNVVRAKGGV